MSICAPPDPHSLPIAHNGCTCSCHKTAGVTHVIPCCYQNEPVECLRLVSVTTGRFYVYYKNNKAPIGEFLVMEDGYYAFWPDRARSGYWTSWMMELLIDALDKLNAEWDAKVRSELHE